MKTLFLTMGDPSGIGPEVLVKTLAKVSIPEKILPIVIGELGILHDLVKTLGLSVRFVPESEIKSGTIPVRSLDLLKTGDFEMGKLSERCGDAAYRYFALAVEECLAGRGHGIVTAPLNKEAMNKAGHHFFGHTDVLEKLTGVMEPVMALWHPKIVVSHVTDHMSLRQALESITVERITHVVKVTHAALLRALGKPPRIALAGVNPHAGENGLLGHEEKTILQPAMAELERQGIPTFGPFPGDTIFLQALQGRFDSVIAMYHDQGFGPMKTLDFAHGVNCTLGLPFVRTSPDHGTAFEIAGKGAAAPESMIAAWNLAIKIIG